ncbi:unnamed protein product [Lathyrus sativus]|nr:unnamed protein product [Lathyrus sativus]
MLINGNIVFNHNSSIWWRYIFMVDLLENGFENFFSKNAVYKVKDDRSSSFWFCRWAGNQTLREAFPESFTSFVDQFYSMADAGQWDNGSWRWFQHDAGLTKMVDGSGLGKFLQEWAEDNTLTHDESELIEWMPEKNKTFSIHSAYNKLVARLSTTYISHEVHSVLSVIWKSLVLSNVLLFGWCLILNRLPTRDQLVKRKIRLDNRDK